MVETMGEVGNISNGTEALLASRIPGRNDSHRVQTAVELSEKWTLNRAQPLANTHTHMHTNTHTEMHTVYISNFCS